MVVWSSERRKRITSSNAWYIAKQRRTMCVAYIVHQLLYPIFRDNSTRWDLEQEKYSLGDWLHDRGSPINIKSGLTLYIATCGWLRLQMVGLLIWLPYQLKELVEFKYPLVLQRSWCHHCQEVRLPSCQNPTEAYSQLLLSSSTYNVLYQHTMVRLPFVYRCWLPLWESTV